MRIIRRGLLPISSLALLTSVVYFATPPVSWLEADLLSWLILYLPLFILFSSLSNLFFNFYARSFTVGLGLTLITILIGLQSLNMINLVIILLAILLTTRSLKKPDQYRRALKLQKLSKLKKQ